MTIRWQLQVEPRPYQTEAVGWALQRERAVCCLPTGTGKTLVGLLWLRNLFENGKVNHALVLEPTRLLVNQTTDYFAEKAGIQAVPIDGRLPSEERKHLWDSPIVVCTAQTALNDLASVQAEAILVDECHHTVGQHAFAQLMAARPVSHRLGLSATVPEKRRREVEDLIGNTRYWSWSDPQVRPYVPNWIGEVYEADLDAEEKEVLTHIRKLRGELGVNPGMLERFLVRDGSSALRESLNKKNKLAAAFGYLLPSVPRRLHKLDVLREVFGSHDFDKAVVFVDRVSIARQVVAEFPEMNPVMFVGKGAGDQGVALDRSKLATTRLIVSTSAGEEGVDLPSADLEIVWGNAASDIRFIQRLGRIMRKKGEGLKFAAFVVTPESSDFDSFSEGIFNATESGAIEVDKTFGWDPEILWPKTTWWNISESLRGRPTSITKIEEALDVRGNMADKVLGNATKRGRVFYLYDVAQIAVDILRHYLDWKSNSILFPELEAASAAMRLLSAEFAENGSPVELARALSKLLAGLDLETRQTLTDALASHVTKFSVNAQDDPERQLKQRRIVTLTEEAGEVGRLLPEQFMTGDLSPLVLSITRGHKGGVKKGFRGGLDRIIFMRPKRKEKTESVWKSISERKWDKDDIGFRLMGSRSCSLDFYYRPQAEAVIEALLGNLKRLLEYQTLFLTAMTQCERCGGLGAAVTAGVPQAAALRLSLAEARKVLQAMNENAMTDEPPRILCLNCWRSEGQYGQEPYVLVEFGEAKHTT